jgi:hypothetical protein
MGVNQQINHRPNLAAVVGLVIRSLPGQENRPRHLANSAILRENERTCTTALEVRADDVGDARASGDRPLACDPRWIDNFTDNVVGPLLGHSRDDASPLQH